MILVDTSVWIEYFKQNPLFISDIQSLLGEKLIVSIEPVFSELLYGVRNRKEKEIILSFWEVLPRIEFGANSMLDAADFANSNSYYQKGIGLMDAIIIEAAVKGNHMVWTLDSHINNSIDQNVQFEPPTG